MLRWIPSGQKANGRVLRIRRIDGHTNSYPVHDPVCGERVCNNQYHDNRQYTRRFDGAIRSLQSYRKR